MTPSPARWEDLLEEAFRIIAAVNRDGDILDGWTFGGGTAMMLQVDHRESHDVDLFLNDPQLLPYVEATVAELQFEIGTASYKGDGHRHPRVSFDANGEIDFTVTGHVTDDCARTRKILGREVLLEAVPVQHRVAALAQNADDGGVGRRTADAELLEPAHQPRLRVA